MAITHLLARRHQFNTLLRQSHSGLDTSQYIRLLALASADIVLSLPLTIYSLVRAAQAARPWPGWSVVHEDWSQVLVHSAAVMSRDNEGLIARMMSKYLCPVLAIIFFLFFGVSDDALNEYTKWARKVAGSLGLRRQPKTIQSYVMRLSFLLRSD
jgi:pheromone a factor receptor